MEEKTLRKLSRTELLELLIQQTRLVDELEQQLADARKQLQNRQIAIDRAGTMAEACLMINGVVEAAEKAAAQYLENIERLSGEQQRVCDAMEASAREQAQRILEETEAACRAREAQCDAYEKNVRKALQRFYDERPGLRERLREEVGGKKAPAEE